MSTTKQTIEHHVGWLRELVPEPLGSALVADAPIGTTQLEVVDAVDFDESGGSLRLNGEIIGYAGIDTDTETILLNGPLAFAADADDMVEVWDTDNAAPAVDLVGFVELLNTNGDDDPVPATLTHALSTMLPLGPRAGRGERVWVEQYGNTWRIVDLLGKQAALDLSAADPDSLGGAKPLAPTGLVLSSSVYVEAGVTRGRIGASWSPVVEDTDGAPLTAADLNRYEVQVQEGTGLVSGSWQAAATTDPATTTATMGPFQVATTYAVRVRAVRGGDTVETKSDWSVTETIMIAADGTAPNKPSTPGAAARLGVHTVTWDGKDYLGNPMPADFAYCELHRSTVNGFTPTPGDLTTLVYRYSGAGKFNTPGTYNVTDYFVLIAVDTSGNASVPSTQASSVAVPLVDTDLIGAVIAGANIKNGTIAAYDKIIGNTITGALVQALAINTGHLQSNAVTADKADIGLLTALLVRGAQMETHAGAFRGVKINNDGIKAYDSSGTNATPTFQVDAVTGAVTARGGNFINVSVTGSLQSGNSTGYVSVGQSGAYGFIDFYDGVRVARIQGTASSLQVTGPSNNGAYISPSLIFLSAPTTEVSGDLTVDGGAYVSATLTSGGQVHGSTIWSDAIATETANSPNVFVTAAGQFQKYSSSAARYKEDIETAAIDTRSIVDVPIREFRYRKSYVDDGGRLHTGFVADDLAERGLEMFVERDEDGEIENVNYLRFAAVGHQAVLQVHERRLDDHDGRVEALERRLTNAGL